MSEDYDIVARPVLRGRPRSKKLDDILTTVTSGQAVRVPLQGESHLIAINRLRNGITARRVSPPITLHVRRDGDDYLVAWCTPRVVP